MSYSKGEKQIPLPSLRDSVYFSLHPALKRWAKLFRPFGAVFCVFPATMANRSEIGISRDALSAGPADGQPVHLQRWDSHPDRHRLSILAAGPNSQIGRASCRERV